jgi:inosine-uridine nucleoside N-ribohydrolase
MEKSYQEIGAVLDALRVEPRPLVLRGAKDWIGGNRQVLECPAADDLISRALTANPSDPLHVVAIGAITNVAIALMKAPEIVDRIVVTWIAANVLDWPTAADFNLKQDIPAAQVLFDSGVALTLVPAFGMASHMICTVPEIERFVEPFGEIGHLLSSRFKAYREGDMWSKEIWDIAAAAWLFDESWVNSELIPRPLVTDQGTFSFDRSRPIMRYISWVKRDAIMIDFYHRLKDLNS